MKVKYKDSIEYKIKQKISRSKSGVILRKEIQSLGSYRQISRVLKKLIEDKFIVKIGYGVYAACYQSEYTEFPLLKNGFDIVARNALDKLGVKWEISEAELAYNSRDTQQVPVNNKVRLKSRFRRNISYQGRNLQFEGQLNAK